MEIMWELSPEEVFGPGVVHAQRELRSGPGKGHQASGVGGT